MFTGLVQHVGTVREVEATPAGRRLVVAADGWAHAPRPGASIAVDGCCLTVATVETAGAGPRCAFDVVPQTLSVTTLGSLGAGDRVNLEPAVTPTTLLGGHIVQGHVDGVGTVVAVTRGADGHRVRVRLDESMMPCAVERGSIALAGVSLTLAAVGPDWIEVALVPTTLAETTLGTLAEGDRVNVETDYVAKTVVRWLERRADAGGITPPSRGSDAAPPPPPGRACRPA